MNPKGLAAPWHPQRKLQAPEPKDNAPVHPPHPAGRCAGPALAEQGCSRTAIGADAIDAANWAPPTPPMPTMLRERVGALLAS